MRKASENNTAMLWLFLSKEFHGFLRPLFEHILFLSSSCSHSLTFWQEMVIPFTQSHFPYAPLPMIDCLEFRVPNLYSWKKKSKFLQISGRYSSLVHLPTAREQQEVLPK